MKFFCLRELKKEIKKIKLKERKLKQYKSEQKKLQRFINKQLQIDFTIILLGLRFLKHYLYIFIVISVTTL